jgi:hypothetical protein
MTLDLPFGTSRAAFLQQLQAAQAVESGTLVVGLVGGPSEDFVQFLFLEPTSVLWEVGTYRDVGRIWRKQEMFLTPDQQALLQAHGFRYDPKESPNYRRVEQIAGPHTLQQIVDESCELFLTVYHAHPETELSFERIE